MSQIPDPSFNGPDAVLYEAEAVFEGHEPTPGEADPTVPDQTDPAVQAEVAEEASVVETINDPANEEIFARLRPEKPTE